VLPGFSSPADSTVRERKEKKEFSTLLDQQQAIPKFPAKPVTKKKP
jgi:hypothetical protein